MRGVQDYSTLFYFNPLPNWVYDRETFEILDVNQSALDHYGYSKDEFLSMTIRDLRPKEEVSKLHAAHVDMDSKQGNIYFGTFTHQKKNRKLIRVDVNGHKVEFMNRKCLMVTCQDVTAKEKQLLELKESEQKLKTASSIAKLGYWRQDMDSNVLSWSDEVYRIWERNRSEFNVTFENFFKTIHPADREFFNREQKALILGEKDLNFCHRILLPDGTVKWVHELGRIKRDAEGKLLFFEGMVQDVTAQKKEEQQLKLLESVITHTNDAILITEAEPLDNPGPRIVYVNEAFTRMTGYAAEEVIGKSPRILQGPKSDRKELARLGRALRNRESCEITTVNYKKSREEFWINLSVSPVADEKGSFTHWISIERDVTTVKNEQIQQELLAKISTVFNEGMDLNSSLQDICQLIANHGEFSFCEIWLPDIHKKTLKLYSCCTLDSVGKEFHAHAERTTKMVIGEGLPGRVFLENKPVIWEDIGQNEFFLRKQAAKVSGLKAVLGMPLFHQENCVGILVVGSRKDGGKLNRHRSVLTKLESFIGSEINRKRLEGELSHLFETLPDIICLCDFNGTCLKMNMAGCELLGYEEDEIVGNAITNFIHPDDKVVLANEIQKLSEGEPVLRFENRLLTKSGKVLWLSWHSNSNVVEGVIYSSGKNITEEKKLQELIGNASQLARIGGWEVDLIQDKVVWSDVVHQIHETDPNSYVPVLDRVIDYYREDFRDNVAFMVQQSINVGEPLDFEAALITAKGNERWVRVIGQVEMVGDKCIRLFGSFQDITNINATEHRLQSITNDLPGVIFQYYFYPDGTDKLVSVSEGSRKIWGLSPQECESNHQLVWDQIRKGGDFQEVMQGIQNSLETHSHWHDQWRSVLPDGGVRWHEGFGTPYRLPDDTILFNSMIFDITAKVKAASLYQEASQLAKIGSWELDLTNQEQGDAMYWSPMVKRILEVEEDYNPSLTGGYEFYSESSKIKIKAAVDKLIQQGVEFDEELLLIAKSGKEKWVRCIGKSERVDGVCTKIFGSFQDIHSMKSTELQLSEILGSISDAFYAVDKDWNFTYFNKEAENLLNRNCEELLGTSIWEAFPSAIGTDLERIYRRVAAQGKAESFEYFYPGDGCWYELNTYPSNGGISSYFRNIDEKRSTAEDLIKAYEEKNRILESIGDAFFALDRQWKVTYWNKEAENVLGKSREEMLGKNLWQKYADAVDTDFYRQYHKAMASGENVSFEEFYPTVNKWFEVAAYPSSEGLSVYFKDITLRKVTDLQIVRANERFEKVTQVTADAIWDWDIENDSYYRGMGFEKFFGYEVQRNFTSADFWQDSFHPDDLPAVIRSLQTSLEDSEHSYWEMEYRVIHSSGEEKIVIDKGMIIRNDAGEAIRMVGAITDISDRKKHEGEIQELNQILQKNIKELKITNEQLEQFAFIASHDLQEPLRMISSFLNQLERKYGDRLDAKAHQYIHFATDGAKRMKQIILDLLEFSRAGQFSDSPELVDLNKLIAEYRVLRRKLFLEKKATLRVDYLPSIWCFKAPLIQTLHCLLDNAIKYSKDGVLPKIELSVVENDHDWELRIADNGIGINPLFFEKIFIIFQRLHNRDSFEGTGIGLSIAKKHVESWGGKIWLESVPGKGSIFYFTINKDSG
ncbi:PAS domain S-box protein [Cyclobacterium jeungdonense]|uniref:histidine kinase n=1 Tax=Cyclobacterium jeungdonense TaxID=708087 RepID=A0ABT8CBF1_9BACT|nr:PAS domain S-box protein [Cyclobacterium jeungdonense]MDN3688918.1 PAS domain S-box protein [Cyclobacterium jeungdonense]